MQGARHKIMKQLVNCKRSASLYVHLAMANGLDVECVTPSRRPIFLVSIQITSYINKPIRTYYTSLPHLGKHFVWTYLNLNIFGGS